MILAWEALAKLTPLVFLDTSRYAFTYVLARPAGAFVACYTYYPMISTDMLERVYSQASLYNNDIRISQRRVDYCILSGKEALPLDRPSQNPYISVAQFHTEKAHELQLEAFASALEQLSLHNTKVRLKLVGSYRNLEDDERVSSLRLKCQEWGLEQNVDFCLNVPYTELVELLGGAIAGLHTMTDEHFIVVEYMARGTVPHGDTLLAAHNSAGPKLDILLNEGGQTGFWVSSVTEFVDAICHVVTMPAKERMEIAQAARIRAARFSELKFDSVFKEATSSILEQAVRRTGIIGPD